MNFNNINLKRMVKEYMPIFYVIFLLIYIIIGEIIYIYQKISFQSFSIGIAVFGFLGLFIYSFNKLVNKVRFDFYDFIIFLLLLFGIISTIFSINKNVSIFGFDGRNEGLLQLFSYYVVFLNCKNMDIIKHKKIIINVILILGLIQSIYAILQFSQIDNVFGLKIFKKGFYSNGFEANQNFLGSLMIISLSLSLSIYFFQDKIKTSWHYLGVSFFTFIGLLTSGTMSAFLALLFFLTFLIILLILLRHGWKSILLKFLIIIIVFLIGYYLFDTKDNGWFIKQVNKTANEINSVSRGEIKKSFGTGRIYIWMETLDILPKYFIAGAGIDNFYYAFGEKPLVDIKSGLIVDKAHNEYLQKLITEGIFSFICYIIFIFSIFINSIIKIFKENDNIKYLFASLFLCFISYLVQAFFNISVISVAPIYYIVMGLLVSEFRLKRGII